MASTRLPGKALADIHGEPMIVHVWRRASEAKCGRVAVAAAEREIADAVLRAGGEAVLTNPDHPSGSDRIFEAATLLDPGRQHDFVEAGEFGLRGRMVQPHGGAGERVEAREDDAVERRVLEGKPLARRLQPVHTRADVALAAWDRCWRREFRGKWALERAIAVAVSSPRLMNFAARGLAARTDLADILVGATGDFVPAGEVLSPRHILQLLAASLAPSSRRHEAHVTRS